MYEKKKTLGCFTVISIMILLALAFQFVLPAISTGTRPVTSTASVPTLTLMPQGEDSSLSIHTESLHSSGAILVRLSDNAVLMQKQIDKKAYPASLTKIMTVLVAIEGLPNLEKKIELPYSMFQPLYQADASMAGFLPEEKVQAVDLLYGALLPSGAECCIGLANEISGSEESFVKEMNQKAEQLGMTSTHFTNSTGLQNENHYTTVKDLSVLLTYALQNKTFRDIFTSSRHSTAITNKHPDGITFTSTLSKHLQKMAFPGGEILGGKTGYTDEAGLCLASLAEIQEKEYILVTVGAQGNRKTEQYDIDDALEVYQNLR